MARTAKTYEEKEKHRLNEHKVGDVKIFNQVYPSHTVEPEYPIYGEETETESEGEEDAQPEPNPNELKLPKPVYIDIPSPSPLSDDDEDDDLGLPPDFVERLRSIKERCDRVLRKNKELLEEMNSKSSKYLCSEPVRRRQRRREDEEEEEEEKDSVVDFADPFFFEKVCAATELRLKKKEN